MLVNSTLRVTKFDLEMLLSSVHIKDYRYRDMPLDYGRAMSLGLESPVLVKSPEIYSSLKHRDHGT